MARPLPAQRADTTAHPPYPPFDWAATYFDAYDRAAAAAGLSILRAAPLPAGEREVRIWTQLERGVPKQLYRFVDRAGRLEGSEFLYWSAEEPDTAVGERTGQTTNDLMRYDLPGRCDHFTVGAGMATCRTRFVSVPDWPGVLRRAEQAGLWGLPDPSALPDDSIWVLDGWTITVELRDGATYRTYRYNSPEYHPKWVTGARAAAIARAMWAIDSLAAPSDVHRVYRGRTSGQYQSAFRPCGGGPAVEFHADLADEASRKGIPMPEVTTAEPDLYVEVFGQVSPKWMVPQSESSFPQVLTVLELRRVETWTERACDRR